MTSRNKTLGALLCITAVLLAAGCAAGEESGETTRTQRPLKVEQLSSVNRGPEQRQLVVSPSAQSLAKATGLEVQGSGEGTYVAACRGRKPTSGYPVGMDSAKLEGEKVRLELTLEKPEPTDIVTQAITYPCAVGLVRGVSPEGLELVPVNSRGEPLEWPVRRVS
jgi:hypothetical protein